MWPMRIAKMYPNAVNLMWEAKWSEQCKGCTLVAAIGTPCKYSLKASTLSLAMSTEWWESCLLLGELPSMKLELPSPGSLPHHNQQVDRDQWLNKMCLKMGSTLQYNLHCGAFLWVTMSWSKTEIITSLLIFLPCLILLFSPTFYREHIPPSNKPLTYQGRISSSTSRKPHLKTTVLNRLWKKKITHYCFTIYIVFFSN